MKNIRNAMRVLALAVVAGLLFVSAAGASPILSVSPATQNRNVGDNVSVNIIVSGLTTDAVGGISFLLGFNSAVLQGTTFVPDPGLDMGSKLNTLDLSNGFGPGGTSPLDVFFLADAALNNAQLLALQGTGFVLATVNFKAIGAGLSPLTISISPSTGVFLSNAAGTAGLAASAVNGSVCVGGAADRCVSAVPEPATFGLLATGLAALVRRRRKTQA